MLPVLERCVPTGFINQRSDGIILGRRLSTVVGTLAPLISHREMIFPCSANPFRSARLALRSGELLPLDPLAGVRFAVHQPSLGAASAANHLN